MSYNISYDINNYMIKDKIEYDFVLKVKLNIEINESYENVFVN